MSETVLVVVDQKQAVVEAQAAKRAAEDALKRARKAADTLEGLANG